MNIKLDLYDKKILYELDKDARLSATKLGNKIQLSKESINYRIRRLLKNKIITYFYTLINASKFGYFYYRVSVKLDKHTEIEEKNILDYLLQKHSCTNIRITDGKYDLVFLASHESIRDFKLFLSEFGKMLGEKAVQRNISQITRTQKYNQMILFSGESHNTRMDHDLFIQNKLDYIDLKILSQIALNGRAKLTDTSKILNLDSKVIRYRLKKMEKTQVIAGYGTILNFEILGFNFIQIDFIFKDPLTSAYVLEFFNQSKRLVNSYELLGKYDLSIEIFAKSDNELREMLDKFKHKFREDYISFDVSRIFKNYLTGMSPFNSK